MELSSYIMVVSSSKADIALSLAIKNTAGTGRVHYGRNTEHGNTELWIIPKSRKTKEELVEKLQALPLLKQLSVVSLSKPVTANELLAVRELFNRQLGWDCSELSNEVLQTFLQARLQGKYSYLIDLKKEKQGSAEILRIIKAEDHPDYSPEWRVHDAVEEEILGRELTVDDVEFENVHFEESKDEPPPDS